MTETINYLRRCADNKVLEASLTPEMCLGLVQMIDHLEAERDAALAELAQAREVLREARDAVEGRTAHLYRGDCPSPRHWLDRDPECPACALLIRIDAALSAKGSEMSLIEKELINARRERDEALTEAAALRRERDELKAEIERITEAGRVHIRRAAAFEVQRDRLADALVELRDRIKVHPAYAELTEDEEICVGGDAAELSYLARVADAALSAMGGGER